MAYSSELDELYKRGLDIPSKVAVMVIATQQDERDIRRIAERFSDLNAAFEFDFTKNDLRQLFNRLSKERRQFEDVITAMEQARSYLLAFTHKMQYLESVNKDD